MKLSIESYEIITLLLVGEMNNGKSEDDRKQAEEALQEVEAIGVY